MEPRIRDKDDSSRISHCCTWILYSIKTRKERNTDIIKKIKQEIYLYVRFRTAILQEQVYIMASIARSRAQRSEKTNLHRLHFKSIEFKIIVTIRLFITNNLFNTKK